MPTLLLHSSRAGLCLWLASFTALACAQYQDTGSQSARGFSSDRTQANISDQGSGYGPAGPYGPYYSRPNNSNQNSASNARQPVQTDGLPSSGLPSDPYLRDWYRRNLRRRSQLDLGVTWSDEDDRLIVREVVADSELGRVGLKEGDELDRVDGQRVRRLSDWQRAVDLLAAGREIVIAIRRDGKLKTLRWTPSAVPQDEPPRPVFTQPEEPRPVRAPEARPIKFITAARLRRGPDRHAWMGAELERQVFDRAVVKSIESGSAADEAGLKPGDEILSLSGRDITSPGELMHRISRIIPGSTVELYVQRPPAGSLQPGPTASIERIPAVAVEPVPATPVERIPAVSVEPALAAPVQPVPAAENQDDVPADKDAPPAAEAPAETEAPAASDAPADEEAPEDTEAPADTEAPPEKEAPTDEEAPPDKEGSSDEEAPADKEAPAEGSASPATESSE